MIESAIVGFLGGMMGASLVGLAAGWLPAWRGSLIEPVSAMRGG